MPRDVFGHRVDRDVDPMGKGLKKQRRRPGVVHHNQCVVTRSVSDGRYRYTRNYVTDIPYLIRNGYRENLKMTFDLYEGESGSVGFQARIAGAPVWVDNVEVRSIADLSYSGAPIPDIAYDVDGLLTEWEVAGPLASPSRAIVSAAVRAAR